MSTGSTPTSLRSAVMDPLLNYKFVVRWGVGDDLVPVAGVSKVGPLSRTTEIADYGNAPGPMIPGQTRYEEIKLERGIILDVAFEQWANQVWYYEQSAVLGDQVSLADFRRTLTVDLCNQAGQTVERFYIFNCWPSGHTALPELGAGDGNTVALGSLTLQNEGWQRDTSFTPAPYPSFTQPE